MLNINGIIVISKEDLERVIAKLPESQKEILRNEFDGRSNSKVQTASEKDYNKYIKRASAKDKIIAEMATENIVNDTKLVKQAVSKYSPEIQDVIKKFTAKEISREAAKSQVNDIFSRVLSSAKSFGTKVAKISVGEANEEAAASILQNANNQIFGGEEKSVPQMADEAFEVWKTTLFGGIPLGAIGGVSALKKNKPVTELIYEVAGNPEKYIPLVQEQAAVNDEYAAQAADILDNIEYAAKVRKALDKSTDITEAQKKRFLVASINANNLQKEAEKIPDPVLRKPIEKEIQKATEEKEKALTEVEIDQDRDLMDEEQELTSAEMKAVKIAAIEPLPGMYQEMLDSNPTAVIKEIANQAQGISEDGTPLEGGGRTQDLLQAGVSQKFIDAAVEAYPAPKQPSISVQMPGEVKKPEVVEPQPAEGLKIGDAVQWTSQGVDQFDSPRKITSISDDGKYAFVEGTNTGIPIEQLSPQPAEEVVEDMTPFVEATRPELAFDEVDTAVLDNMDSKTMAVQGKRIEGINKNLGKLKELFDCIWS